MVGFAAGGSSASYTLFAEFAPTEHRGNALLIEQGFWSFGALFGVVAAWIFIPTSGWRLYVAMCSVPLWIILCMYKYVPESPRYLIGQGRLLEAEELIREIASTNEKELPPGNLIDMTDENNREQTHVKYIFLPAYRYTSILLLISFFCVVFTYYGICFESTNLFKGGNLYWEMFITTLSEIPGLFFGYLVLDRIG
eukprot:UN32296